MAEGERKFFGAFERGTYRGPGSDYEVHIVPVVDSAADEPQAAEGHALAGICTCHYNVVYLREQNWPTVVHDAPEGQTYVDELLR